MITVVCLWLRGKGKRAYGIEYVERLRSMVSRNLSLPHRFVCMTDTPRDVPAGIEAIRLKRPETMPIWWLKLRLFSAKLGWQGRLLYIDLDTLIVGSLDEIATFPAPFALLPCMAPGFTGRWDKPHLKVVHRYNSSVMVLDAGTRNALWDDWQTRDAVRFWSDQDWIGERMPNEATFPREWFERLILTDAPFWTPQAKVILCIKHKNAKAAKQLPWFAERWR